MKVVKRRNKQQTMNRILLAAAETIADQNIDKAGINAIAAQAGINKVLLYRYFGGWNGTIEALYAKILAEIQPCVIQETGDGLASDNLKVFTIHFVRVVRSNKAFQRLLYWEIEHQETGLARSLASLLEASIQNYTNQTDTKQTSLFRLLIPGIILRVLRNPVESAQIEEDLQQIYSLI